MRPLFRASLAAGVIAAASAPAAGSAAADDLDAIRALLRQPGALQPAPSPPQQGTGPVRVFSPQAISDLLKREGARDMTPTGSLPKLAEPASGPGPTSLDPSMTGAHLLSAEAVNATRFSRVNPMGRTVDPVVLKAEILLDRAHAPPGVIDGRFGSNFTKAISAFETVRGLPVDGKLSRRVWDELGGDTAAPVLGTYTVTAQDVVGPFYPDLPSDYALQAKLPTLGYRSPEEMFGERFHMDHKFLRALNPSADMGLPGTMLTVAEVATPPLAARIARIDVDKGKGQVLAYDGAGALVVAYPATIGSDELPSPSGSWAVRGIAPHPTYTYDPKKNFQQGSNTQKLILPAGPNNPVGAAFIALTKPTYGIHGTPDPSKIDKTRSHGCVRLTNWNAQELAGMVQVGVPVNFLDKPGTEAAVVAPTMDEAVAAASQPDTGDGGIEALLRQDRR